MRTKPAFLLAPLMLMLCLCAFAMPMTAYAASADDTTPPSITATLEGETLYIDTEDDLSGVEAVYIDGSRVTTLVNGDAAVLLKDYAGTGAQVRMYALDYAGNRSDTLALDNPYASGEGEAADPGMTFTPDGAGTILDEATEAEDNKQFYTITSEAGNVFYLIIDGNREDNNVYFLNTVTEDDLMALAEKDKGSESAVPEVETCSCSVKCEAGAVHTACPVCKLNLNGCIGKAPEPEPQDEPEDEGGSGGLIIFLVLALLIAGGAGYYFKILRPRQQAALDDGDFEDESYGEGFDPDAEYGQMDYLPEDDGAGEDYDDNNRGDGQ